MSNQTRHLLALAITPVQAFIKEARKAQDLWSGSLIVSHMAREALLVLSRPERLFPSPPLVVSIISPWFDLEQEQVADKETLARPRLTNEVIAQVDGDREVARTLARAAAGEARQFWRNIAAETIRMLEQGGVLGDDDCARWEQQVEGQFTVVWAVAPVDPATGEARAVDRLRALLGAAKLARQVPAYQGDSRPKCALCGAWEQLGPIEGHQDFWKEEGTFGERVGRITDRLMKWAIQARIEPGGREALCAVCLVKRLAPVLVFVERFGFDDPGLTDSSPLRFPSTTAVAWAEQKQRLFQWAAALDPTQQEELGSTLERFNTAVKNFARGHGLPLGRHVMAFHSPTLAQWPATANPGLRSQLATLLHLDGDWLGDPRDGDRANPVSSRRGFIRPAKETADRLENELNGTFQALKERVNGENLYERPVWEAAALSGVRLGRNPPVVLLRADADHLGLLQARVIQKSGSTAATNLSERLGKAVEQARKQLEGTYLGRAAFSGGDELLGMLPAAETLPAAGTVSDSYEAVEVGVSGLPRLTCSVAVVVVASDKPLRMAITELNELLDQAKAHRRRLLDDQTGEAGETGDRRAFGLAVIPGSGNIKRGVVGLRVPRTDGTPGTWKVLADVLVPLAQAISLPEGSGLEVSPKLYREWIERFEPFVDEKKDQLPFEFLPRAGDPEGIVLAEFRRLARRHIDAKSDVSESVERAGKLLPSWVGDLVARSRAQAEQEPRKVPGLVKSRLVDHLVQRVHSLLISGSPGDDEDAEVSQYARWGSLRGLLLGVTALATREIR